MDNDRDFFEILYSNIAHRAAKLSKVREIGNKLQKIVIKIGKNLAMSKQ